MQQDFDFEFGSWTVKHRRLRERLLGCQDWDEFDGLCTARPILDGAGNFEENLLHLPGGDCRAIAIRSFDAATESWAIWWLSSLAPHQMDVPVIGRFKAGVGEFLADDRLRGNPIKVRFLWTGCDTDTPHWQQAFSADGGDSWETNWTMEFTRA